MPYTPPNVFTGDLQSQAYNENVRAIADFYNNELDYTEIATGSVQTKHINRPTTRIISQDAYQVYFESGLLAKLDNLPLNTDAFTFDELLYQHPWEKTLKEEFGFQMPAAKMAGANGFINAVYQGSDYFSGSWTAGNTQSKVKPVPKSTVSVVVPQDARVLLISYTGELLHLPNPYNPVSQAGKGTVFYVGINGVPEASTLSYVAPLDTEDANAGGSANYVYNRRHFTLHHQTTDLSAGDQINISLLAGVGYGVSIVGKLSVVAEFIY